jgi:hypothetical protein
MANEEVDSESVMLTTEDNPYNPFEQWDEWLAYDSMKGYNTPSLLARVAVFSDELSEKDQTLSILTAMDSILKINIYGNYIKVTKEYFKK